MGTREVEELPENSRALYPYRHIAVYRDRGFYVIHNLLTEAKRYYADARDVAQVLDLGRPVGV